MASDQTQDPRLAVLLEASRGIANEQWARELLGLGVKSASPSKREIQRRFRRLVRDAHPDHGAESEGAAQRIAELTEARRILLGS